MFLVNLLAALNFANVFSIKNVWKIKKTLKNVFTSMIQNVDNTVNTGIRPDNIEAVGTQVQCRKTCYVPITCVEASRTLIQEGQ